MDRGNKYLTQLNYGVAQEIIRKSGITNAQEADKLMALVKKQFIDMQSIETVKGQDLYEKYKDLADKPIKFDGLATGIQSLDDELMGVKPKDLILIGAETGVGKSSFGLFMLLNFVKQGKKCLAVHFEDSEDEIAGRFVKMVRSNDLEPEGIEFMYEDSCRPIVADKTALLPALQAQVQVNGVQVIMVDMLNNLVDTSNDKDSSEYVNSLRSFCTSNDVIMILTCRLRQPQNDTERFVPHKFSFSGKVDLTYSCSKALTIVSSYEPNEPTVLVVDSLKNRIRNRDNPKTRAKVNMDGMFLIKDMGTTGYPEG